jgi:glycine/D-amino acid oxidase-like deaminating enzyme
MELKRRPYWWDATTILAPGRKEELETQSLPAKADVLIVGAGLTGVSAAHHLASAGRKVVALEANGLGTGASSRNAGMIGRYLKHSFTDLIKARGLDTAKAYFSEVRQVYDQCVDRIKTEQLDCDYRPCGRFVGAMSPAQRDSLFKEFELRAKYLNEEIEFISDVPAEMGTQIYHGGVRIIENGSLQPAKHYEAMLKRARTAGATVIGHNAVTGIIGQKAGGFEVHTSRGITMAKDVVLATNGYSAANIGDVGTRVAPINALMVATEALSTDLIASLFPHHRTYHDNRRDANFMQVSPDRTRLLFGGRTGLHRVGNEKAAAALQGDMVRLFPQLRGVKIEYVWTGKCAATVDLFPHVGMHKGMHYALGYCYSGNAMAPYLGIKAAKRILNDKDADTLFRTDRLPRMPWPARQEWLMPAVIHYFRWADRPKA